MTLHAYFWSLRLSVLMAVASLCAVIYFINPFVQGVTAYLLFYIALFASVASVSTLVLTRLWYRRRRESITTKELSMALRQGILIGLLVGIFVGLKQARALVWWDMLLVACGIILIEIHSILYWRGDNAHRN